MFALPDDSKPITSILGFSISHIAARLADVKDAHVER